MKTKYRKSNLVIICIIMMIILVPSMIVYNIAEINHEAESKEKLLMITELDDITLEFVIWLSAEKERFEIVKGLVENHRLSDLTYSATNNKYLRTLNDIGEVVPIYIGFSDGKIITTDSREADEEFNPQTRLWYKEAIERNKTVLSEAYRDYITGKITITISSPLRIEDELVGVIAMDVDLSMINDFFVSLVKSEAIEIGLLDSNNVFLVNTKKPEHVGYSLDEVIDEDTKKVFYKGIEENNRLTTHHKSDGIHMLYQRQIPEFELILLVESEIMESSILERQLPRRVIALNALFLLLIIVMIFIMLSYDKKLRNKNQELAHKSSTDGLTQIKNRRTFEEEAGVYWQNAQENNNSVGLIMLDVDYFKNYNDHYGHLEGDRVLKKICRIIEAIVDKKDVFARYGGEEFIIMRYGADEENIKLLSKQIVLEIFNEKVPHNESPLNYLSVSVGAKSIKPNNENLLNHFIYEADMALYEAKSSGKNTVR